VPLTPKQLATLRAAADRIVPADEFPSASALGVVEFLTKLIREENFEELYATGLDGLDREAKAMGEEDFESVSASTQDQILKSLEAGTPQTEWTVAPQEFFELLARQTIEGYYADPSNGGNKDGAAWEMVGFRVTS
jgi:hypothetical protein